MTTMAEQTSKPPSAPYEEAASTPVVAEYLPPPAPISPPVSENRSFTTALFGNVEKRGRIKRHNWFITFFGNHKLDLRESYLPSGCISIVIIKFFGDANLIVPPGTAVTYNSVTFCGDRVIDTPEPTGDAPRVTLFMLAPLCGSVRVTNE